MKDLSQNENEVNPKVVSWKREKKKKEKEKVKNISEQLID